MASPAPSIPKLDHFFSSSAARLDRWRELNARAQAWAAAPAPRQVILDLSSAPRVDMQGAHSLAELGAELSARGVRLRICGARAAVRAALRRHGLEGRLGPIDRTALAELVEEFQKPGGSSTCAAPVLPD